MGEGGSLTLLQAAPLALHPGVKGGSVAANASASFASAVTSSATTATLTRRGGRQPPGAAANRMFSNVSKRSSRQVRARTRAGEGALRLAAFKHVSERIKAFAGRPFRSVPPRFNTFRLVSFRLSRSASSYCFSLRFGCFAAFPYFLSRYTAKRGEARRSTAKRGEARRNAAKRGET